MSVGIPMGVNPETLTFLILLLIAVIATMSLDNFLRLIKSIVNENFHGTALFSPILLKQAYLFKSFFHQTKRFG